MKVVRVNFEKLKKVAKAKSWTGHKLALATGITSQGINQTLNGTTSPKAVNLKKICDTIGVPIEDAFIEEKASA